MKFSRRALLMILLLALCFAALTGGTVAWFTGEVTSTGNIIATGTLDVGLYWAEEYAGQQTAWQDAAEGAVFDTGHWEPGHTQRRYIKVANEGDLALGWQLQIVPQQTAADAADLAQVLDVYVLPAEEAAALSRQQLPEGHEPVGTLAGLMQAEDGIARGILLPENGGSGNGELDPAHRDMASVGAKAYCIVLHMQESAGNEYQGKSAGGGFAVRLKANQYTYEKDAFGNDYDAAAGEGDGTITVIRTRRILPDAVRDLPEGALAAAPGVVFSTAPYAYTDTGLFAGKHITRIGIPVKAVKALDGNQTFTLSVVKTTPGAYSYVSKHKLTLPREQLGDFTTVNKWIYVDVDLQLAADETLAFGMPDDTVTWGYAKTANSAYSFRSATGNWTSPIKESILFDVYATETLTFTRTEQGLASVSREQVLPKVLSDFPESAIASGNDVEFSNPPYSYLNQSLFKGKRITRIGIPVKRVQALDENQTFTLSVIKTGSGNYQYVSQHTLKMPLEQLGGSTTVNKWIYLDVDIALAEDETLAFGGKDDTVIWAWKRNFADAAYSFRDAGGGSTKGIFFDITAETVLTYSDYLAQQKAEEEKLQAEQEQQRLDALLQNKLAGKGLSVLGDSISTFSGWSNNTKYNATIGSNAVYYTGSRDGFAAVNETWWMQSLTRSGMELVVNNSWSGDEVTDRGISRSLQLHNNEARQPDIIAVYLGINDFRRGKTEAVFGDAYDRMIAGLKAKYADADVYLFTLLYTTNMEKSYWKPAEVVKYNRIIAQTAEKYGCTLVDIYTGTGITPDNLSTYMGDKTLHPNYAGMDLITQCFVEALRANYLQ